MKWRTYPAYRDSGVEWLGDVPEHWETKRLKYLSSVNDDALPETTEPDFGISYVDISSVDAVNGISRREEMTFENAPSRARRRVRDGDVIVSTVRTYLRAIAPVVDPEPNMIVSTGFAVVRPGRELNRHFAAYALRSPYFVDAVVARSVGVSYPAINATEMIELPLALTSVDEQQAIAAFLDRETTRIDDLIAKKQRQIELLQEKRSALISHVVTKGLDPNVKMKDSGVEWLGEIPEHWRVCKTKYVAALRSGHTPSRQHPEYWEHCTIPWFSLADVWQLRDGRREYIHDTKEKISELGLLNSAADLLPPKTVIVSRTASVGFSGIMSQAMATTQDFVNWVCGPRIVPEYLLYVFRSMREEFRRLIMGSTHQTIYMPDASSFQTPIPPLEEQESIINFIRGKKAWLEEAEDKVAFSIDLLRGYRTALISAAVTGKIDVREEVA